MFMNISLKVLCIGLWLRDLQCLGLHLLKKLKARVCVDADTSVCTHIYVCFPFHRDWRSGGGAQYY